MNIIEWFVLLVCLLPAVVGTCYHGFLGLIGWIASPKIRDYAKPQTRFALLVPAHNEEKGIAEVLSHLQHTLDYPNDLYTIYVVADNCTDATEQIASEAGCRVIRRTDEHRRGKGYALNYAIPIILDETDCDGILVVDADCFLDAHSLLAVNDRVIEKSEKPQQLCYVVGNPDESPTSYLLAVANCLENNFFYAPKDFCRMFVMLRGTGMFLPRYVLEQTPWEVFSIVEDTDYTLRLLSQGISVGFIAEARVLSAYPAEQKTLEVQRKRWISGTLATTITRHFQLVFQGLLTFQPRMVDAGITLLVLSRPLIISQLLLTTLISVALLFTQSPHALLFTTVSLTCWGIYGLYLALAVFRLGLTRNRLKMLAVLPMQSVWYLLMALRSLLGKKTQNWDRTPRE